MIETQFYLHSSKDDNYEDGEGLGLTGEALSNFRYAGYEVTFEVEIDEKTGDCWATAVNGVKLEKRVKI